MFFPPLEFGGGFNWSDQLAAGASAILFFYRRPRAERVFDTAPGSTGDFDFGDGHGVAGRTALPHTGIATWRYEVLVRIAVNGRLTEYRAAVVVSKQILF